MIIFQCGFVVVVVAAAVVVVVVVVAVVVVIVAVVVAVVVVVVVAVVVGGADCCWSCGRLSTRRGVVHSWGVQACQCWTHLLTCHWSRPHYHLHHLSHSHQHTNQIETHTTKQSKRYQPGVNFSSFP